METITRKEFLSICATGVVGFMASMSALSVLMPGSPDNTVTYNSNGYGMGRF